MEDTNNQSTNIPVQVMDIQPPTAASADSATSSASTEVPVTVESSTTTDTAPEVAVTADEGLAPRRKVERGRERQGKGDRP